MVFLPFTSVKFCQLLLPSLTLEIYTTYLLHFPSVLILISFFNTLPRPSLLYSSTSFSSTPLPRSSLLSSPLLYSNHLLQLFPLNFSASLVVLLFSTPLVTSFLSTSLPLSQYSTLLLHLLLLHPTPLPSPSLLFYRFLSL